MSKQWPFMAQFAPGENVQVRFLETEPLDLPPPPGFLPEALENPPHCPFGDTQPGRIPVRVLAVNGVAKRDTYMMWRPITLQKLQAAINEARNAPLEPSD